MDLDYLFGHHARTLLRISVHFVKPVYDSVPSNKNRQLWDSDNESKKDDVVKLHWGNEAYSSDVSDEMDKA